MFYLGIAFAAPGGVGTTTAVNAGGHAVAVAAAPAGGSRPSGAAVAAGRPQGGASSGFRSPVNVRPTFGGGTGSSHVFSSPGQHLGNAPVGIARTPVSLPTANNAWTDPVGPRVTGMASGNGTAVGGRNRSGSYLYPGAYGYTPSRPANGHSGHGQNGGDGFRGRRRYYYNNFPYAVYYPYLYNNYGYGNLGYDGAGTYVGIASPDNDTPLGAPDFTNTPNNYYSYEAPESGAADAGNQPAPAQALPDAPTVGPQNPSATEKATGAPQGPDSLVEAVQGELSRRGYFEGKPDAMYTPATREAIHRFQSDQHLPATGRINEATLHALHLD